MSTGLLFRGRIIFSVDERSGERVPEEDLLVATFWGFIDRGC